MVKDLSASLTDVLGGPDSLVFTCLLFVKLRVPNPRDTVLDADWSLGHGRFRYSNPALDAVLDAVLDTEHTSTLT